MLICMKIPEEIETWKKGKSEKQTRRKSTSFMIDGLQEMEFLLLIRAEEYGKYSSQYYRIEKIMQDGKLYRLQMRV